MKNKIVKCDICVFFPKEAVGYIELHWASTKRYFVCEKHKEKMIADNKEAEFKDPSFTPRLKFIKI